MTAATSPKQVRLLLNDYELILANGLLQTRGPDPDIARDLGKRFAELIRSPKGQRIPRQLLTGNHEQIEDVESRLVTVLRVPPPMRRPRPEQLRSDEQTDSTVTTVCETPDPPTADQRAKAQEFGLPVSSSISQRVMARRIAQFERTLGFVNEAWRALTGAGPVECGVPEEEIYRLVRQLLRNAPMMRRIDLADATMHPNPSPPDSDAPSEAVTSIDPTHPVCRDIGLLLRHRWHAHLRKPWLRRFWPFAPVRRAG